MMGHQLPRHLTESATEVPPKAAAPVVGSPCRSSRPESRIERAYEA